MELVLGFGKQLVEGRDVAGIGADGQGRRIGMLPRLEGKALGELGQERGIRGIGLGAGLHGLSEAFGGLGVDHHDIQPGASSRATARSKW